MDNPSHHFNNVIIASGPVIINEENKVLLNKHGDSDLWKFPGGDIYEPVGELEMWAIKRAQEEMGLDIKIAKAIKPMVIWQGDQVIILIHYLAELINEEFQPADYIREWSWIDINNLPNDCSPNIKPVIEEYKKLKI
ncbi:MAG: NUDIX domain-containing protein [Candidatus Buchananbacteria bacterium]